MTETPIQDKLSDKRKVFVQVYCINGHNASEAYKIAYPNCKNGYNAHGARMIAKDSIKQAIDERMAVINEKTEMDEAAILKALVSIASLGTETGKLRALELLGKNRKMWVDRVQTDDSVIPKEFTDSELARLKAIAKGLTKPDIKLHKEA